MKKVLAIILCAVTLLALVSCGGDKTPETTVNKDAVVVTNDSKTPDLPEADKLGDISGDFNILVAGNWEWNDFESAGETGTAIDVAIHRRNQYILEKYNVNITNEDVVAYNSAMGSGTGYQKIYKDYMAGDANYDAAFVGTYDVATLAYNGYLHDLNDVGYINLTKDYWDQKANEDLSMNGRMYYTTGDISVADNRATYVLFFSKDMAADYGIRSPYDYVENDEWTLENFAKIVKSVGNDDDLNGIYDKNDTFGLLTPTDTHLAILAAADERIAAINDKGEIELTFYNERVVNLYDDYLDLVTDHSHVYNYQHNYVTGENGLTSTNEERIGMFNSKKALFYSHTMFYMDYLRDLESDFGILPYPKYDATQENYGNLVSAWHSQFVCVPETVVDLDRTGIILEELAHYGMKYLTPAYYDKTLNGQYVRDEESSEMLDIIFANRVYDIGTYYNVGKFKDQIVGIVRNGTNVTNIYETYRNAAVAQIKGINDFFGQNTATDTPAVTEAPATTTVAPVETTAATEVSVDVTLIPVTTDETKAPDVVTPQETKATEATKATEPTTEATTAATEAPAPVDKVTSKTVVFVADGGSGDGSSADKALATLEEAYEALDMSKDCTVVISGEYNQTTHFDLMKYFDGSVTITSVYDGVDYRKTNGAIYKFKPSRFYLRGETKFENITFEALGTNLLVLAQFNPITIGEGVTMLGDKMTGGNTGKSFCIVGGFQDGTVDATPSCDKDTNITVLSGSKLYIVPFTRQIAGSYMGTANVYIGGNAYVRVINASAAFPDGITLGNVNITIDGDAFVENFYGCTQDTTVNSYELNWKSGNIGLFEWVCHTTPDKTLTVTNGKTLNASDVVKQYDNYGEISGYFDTVN